MTNKEDRDPLSRIRTILGDLRNGLFNDERTVNELLDEALDLLDANGWIPVSQRLPEATASTKLYLGYDADYLRIGLCYFNGARLVLTEDDDCSITHWMPLPSPPQSPEQR